MRKEGKMVYRDWINTETDKQEIPQAVTVAKPGTEKLS
jgi:hypothetical protein